MLINGTDHLCKSLSGLATANQLLESPLRFWSSPSVPAYIPTDEETFQGAGTFSLSQSPPRCVGPLLIPVFLSPFLFLFSFVLSGCMEIFLPFQKSKFCQCSVNIVKTVLYVNVFLKYLWEKVSFSYCTFRCPTSQFWLLLLCWGVIFYYTYLSWQLQKLAAITKIYVCVIVMQDEWWGKLMESEWGLFKQLTSQTVWKIKLDQ